MLMNGVFSEYRHGPNIGLKWVGLEPLEPRILMSGSVADSLADIVDAADGVITACVVITAGNTDDGADFASTVEHCGGDNSLVSMLGEPSNGSSIFNEIPPLKFDSHDHDSGYYNLDITYDMLFAASDAAVFDGDVIVFPIESVAESNSLTEDGVPVVPGDTMFWRRESVMWTSPAGHSGMRSAFFVVMDGVATSGFPVVVSIRINPSGGIMAVYDEEDIQRNSTGVSVEVVQRVRVATQYVTESVGGLAGVGASRYVSMNLFAGFEPQASEGVADDDDNYELWHELENGEILTNDTRGDGMRLCDYEEFTGEQATILFRNAQDGKYMINANIGGFGGDKLSSGLAINDTGHSVGSAEYGNTIDVLCQAFISDGLRRIAIDPLPVTLIAALTGSTPTIRLSVLRIMERMSSTVSTETPLTAGPSSGTLIPALLYSWAPWLETYATWH